MQQYLDSLNIQMEGTCQLLDAAAAVETVTDRQQMLQVFNCLAMSYGLCCPVRALALQLRRVWVHAAALQEELRFNCHGSACRLAVACGALP